ncbi:Ankyrin repeat domain-containing protein [Tetrabaena socialis]|uniref:Ankyrin repeat domain-containing protein n=1 Tax=Tetrabaena socialis TaxID=47790 RepID=A0A2J8A615_9CHLO|nr:Ankyrin repeat domain-containing protein [Tetrabaena socialis]|eukprot:PNH07972.1 Ankyrin repeat domain-containing protein [Tetrabaena socialis]
MEPQRASKRQRTGSPLTLPSPPQHAAAAAPSDPSRVWLPEFVQRFAASLPPNEVACILRLVNKAAAAQYRGPQHATIRLSQPVPHREFAWRWAGPDAMRRLVRSQREALPRLTAGSGSIANLEVLLAREDVANPLNHATLHAAAAAGQMEVCVWLRERGCPVNVLVLAAAAGGGHRAVCDWLLANGCSEGDMVEAAAAAAARAGHVGLMEWLLGGSVPHGRASLFLLIRSVAAVCDLPTLQRLHHTYLDSRGEELVSWDPECCVIGAAIASPSADWQAKVEWLESRGYPRTTCGAWGWAACTPDALSRLTWLQQRGYPIESSAARRAAETGNVEALEGILGQGVALDNFAASAATSEAARRGNVAVMQVLHAHGALSGQSAVEAAAGGGHLHAVAWLVETLGADVALTVATFACAAAGRSRELLVWLRERNCPWDEDCFRSAAGNGSEEQLEWLAEHGCPMPVDGLLYAWAAIDGQLGMLRCLRRLGCPWSPDGRTFACAVGWARGFEEQLGRALGWLLDEGCPVDWGEAEAIAVDEALKQWLRAQQQQRT